MEYHVLIVWNKAGLSADDIVKRLPISINICKIINYEWDYNLSLENFAAFYGERLENLQYKVDHCGGGPFLVFLLQDNSPTYMKRRTSTGIREVNINIFDFKMKLREITGGGHLIHASDNQLEANLNSISLFGSFIHDFIEKKNSRVSNGYEYVSVCRNITGVGGWNSWIELFHMIDKVSKYVILRNINTVTNNDSTLHGDVDLLVSNYSTAATVLAGKKKFKGQNRVLFSVNVEGKERLIDLRYVSDGYYCKEWEEHIIANREMLNCGIYVPSCEDFQYSILYHALVQKPIIFDDYKNILSKYFKKQDRQSLMDFLDKFMKKNNYDYSIPKDRSVFIHPDFFKDIKVNVFVNFLNKLKVIKYKIKEGIK